ncbi:alpha/beta-hydrolase [Phellopilus nigrolimitatus]|nr:alpha/beta-hydrolase [Phellopilus nigrolimitatus]
MALGINIARQPFKGIYVGYSLLGLWFVRVPYWSLRNLLPAWRPRRSWSILRCLQVNLARFFTQLGEKVGSIGRTPDHRTLELGKGVDGLYVDGVPELVAGDVKKWADFAGVEPTRIPGYWQHKSGSHVVIGEKPRGNEKVAYFLHGGAYVAHSAHPATASANIPRSILAHTPSLLRAFAIEYRLTSPDANPFPSQLLDALAGYNYLVGAVGFSPENIIIVGDSAGANLALALTRYLVSNSGTLPLLPAPPGALVLLSPWGDLTGSHDTPGSTAFRHGASDFVSPPHPQSKGSASNAYAGPHGYEFLANEYISPASKNVEYVSFKGFPRTFISIGDAEVLVDQIQTLRERLVADVGEERVETLVSKDACHDFLWFDWFEPQREEALTAIASWIESF